MGKNAEQNLMTVQDVAQYMGLSVYKIYDMLCYGELRGFKVGKSWRVKPADVEKYLTARSNETRRQFKWM